MSHFEVRNAIEEVKAGKNLHIHINSEFPLVREYVSTLQIKDMDMD